MHIFIHKSVVSPSMEALACDLMAKVSQLLKSPRNPKFYNSQVGPKLDAIRCKPSF